MKAQSHRIGIYIRVSTEEQAENPEGSIKSQEQRLRQHVTYQNQDRDFGEITHVFIDRGKSGKDIEHRPELNRLLQCIGAGQISLVLVTELSRLSRSIQDFCQMWELMRKHNCEFQSLREQFDTTTAAGEMVLYTIANISQFERKQCSERIKANFLARAERGLFNGGSVPIGYALDPNKKGYLQTHPEEAALIREAFETFMREGSLSQAGKSLNERGIKLPKKRVCGGNYGRLGYFTMGNLYDILTNSSYIGRRVFQKMGEQLSVKACWEPIVDEALFQDVQIKLKNNKGRNKIGMRNRYPFLLSGLVKCGTCGDRLPGKSAHGNGGKVPYYEHGWAMRRQAMLNKRVFHCNPHRINGKRLEELVWLDVLEMLTDPAVGKSLIEKTCELHSGEDLSKILEKQNLKIKAFSDQIEALSEHLTKIPKGVSPGPIFAQMQKMEELKLKAHNERDVMLVTKGAHELPASWTDFENYLKLIREMLPILTTPELRTKIIALLVHQIEIFPDRAKLYYFVGEGRVKGFREISGRKLGFTGASGVLENGQINAVSAMKHKEKPGSEFLQNPGSSTLTSGSGGRI